MQDINIVYFSSVTENTKKFVDKLGFPSQRIPVYAKDDFLYVDKPYVLITPTYGGDGSGSGKGAVPKQVIKFLNNETNRNSCIGVIGAGNINFYDGYALAGRVISQKLNVPELYKFELMGMPHDVEKVQEGLINSWNELLNLKNNA